MVDHTSDRVKNGSIEALNSGDEVLHAGEKWRVARLGGEDVEIYRLSEHRSIIDPIDSVEPVPEVGG